MTQDNMWRELVDSINQEYPDYTERVRQYLSGELSEEEARKVEDECQVILGKAW
jgi:hypothetical protein